MKALLLSMALACGAAVSGHAGPIDADAGSALAAQWSARGVQIYECRAEGDAFVWGFVEPRADLLDAAGRVVGHHGAGPFWQAADGSRIVGRVKARADAPQGAGAAIPWLLLVTQRRGPVQQGMLTEVHRVQRLNTEGGLAPAVGCDRERLGQRTEVPYRADYLFFVPTSTSL